MKQTGILMAVSSLPGAYGVGELGTEAFAFIDILTKNKIDIWQILPLNPTGYGNSPYQAYSSFAGDELYISLEELHKQGLLHSLPPAYNGNQNRVDYETIRAWKTPILKQAFITFQQTMPTEAYQNFAKQKWVRDYAIFRALKSANNGVWWLDWSEKERDWFKEQNELPAQLSEEFEYHIFLQYQFLCQWQAVKSYANDRNIRIMGDVPFYVGIDSVDVWANREFFLLDEKGYPQFIAGVPPDYFSKTGQRWGNPIYDWDMLSKTQFQFWVERIGYNQAMFDIIRIDHFRAFDTFWKVPASCPTAIEGEWIESPGYAVIDTLYEKIPNLCMVAEDLGELRPEVLQLRDHYKLKGMKILEFDIDVTGKYAKYIGENKKNQILYTGTHDNATLLEWYRSLSIAQRRKVRQFLKQHGYKNKSVVTRLNTFALSQISDWVILPMQDILELGAESRMNMPSTVGSPNWEWRLSDLHKAEQALCHIKQNICMRKNETK